jgi:hypothetical protein
MDDNTIIQRKKDILQSKVDNDYVLMSLKKNGYYGLNSVAGRVWELIEEPVTFKAITDKLIQEYDIDHKTCKEEIIKLLKTLKNSGLLEKS